MLFSIVFSIQLIFWIRVNLCQQFCRIQSIKKRVAFALHFQNAEFWKTRLGWHLRLFNATPIYTRATHTHYYEHVTFNNANKTLTTVTYLDTSYFGVICKLCTDFPLSIRYGVATANVVEILHCIHVDCKHRRYEDPKIVISDIKIVCTGKCKWLCVMSKYHKHGNGSHFEYDARAICSELE